MFAFSSFSLLSGMKHPIAIRNKKVGPTQVTEKLPNIFISFCYSLVVFFCFFFTASFVTGRRSAVPLRPDLRRPLLGPAVADFWMQHGTEDRSLQRRLPGSETREALPGQRKHLPCESAEGLDAVAVFPQEPFLLLLLGQQGSRVNKNPHRFFFFFLMLFSNTLLTSHIFC